MDYGVSIRPAAEKVLAEVPAGERERIRDKIEDLRMNPRPADGQVVPESTPQLFFVYEGAYQIEYHIQQDTFTIDVISLRKQEWGEAEW